MDTVSPGLEVPVFPARKLPWKWPRFSPARGAAPLEKSMNSTIEHSMPHDRGVPMKRSFAGFAAFLLLTVSFPSGAGNLVDHEYEDAVRSFRIGRTSDAYGKFIDLANRGDVDSARIALFMSQYGAVLLNKHWDASPAEIAYWTMLVGNSGSTARAQPEFTPAWVTPVKAAKAAKPRTVIKNVAASR